MTQPAVLRSQESTERAPSPAHGSTVRPAAPRNLRDTDLSLAFVAELVRKILFLRGRTRLIVLADAVKLPPSVLHEVLVFLRSDHSVEVIRGGDTDADAEFQLSDSGRTRAIDALERCQYAGPAPVTIERYVESVERQSLARNRIVAETVRSTFARFVIPPGIVDQIGAALNSGRALLLYGPAGSGKTFLAERMAMLLADPIAIPHSILVGGEIVQIHDALVHEPIDDAPGGSAGVLRSNVDERWVACKRPVVITGGELTLAMLDLQFDPVTRFYQAPPHVKANGGLMVVDDLGRQLVAPRDLMNRWIVPLSRQRDYLSLHNGFKFQIPFEMAVVFSTNLRPTELADEAFLRRFGYKVFVGPLGEADYRRVFEGACADNGVRFDGRSFDWLVTEKHATEARPLLACYPADLVGRIRDFAAYEGGEPAMDPASLERAWRTYFVSEAASAAPGTGADE